MKLSFSLSLPPPPMKLSFKLLLAKRINEKQTPVSEHYLFLFIILPAQHYLFILIFYHNVLIRFAQTDVNYFPLKCNTYKTNSTVWWLDAQAFQPREKYQSKTEKRKKIPRKNWLSLSDLKRFEEPSLDLSGSKLFFFFSAAFFAFLRRFTSSEFEARSSDSYSWTISQPSLLRSAIFILLRIICCASCTKLRTWLGVVSTGLLFGKEDFLAWRSPQTASCYLWIWIPRRTSLFSTGLL